MRLVSRTLRRWHQFQCYPSTVNVISLNTTKLTKKSLEVDLLETFVVCSCCIQVILLALTVAAAVVAVTVVAEGKFEISMTK